jgi:WD40 repeat protein
MRLRLLGVVILLTILCPSPTSAQNTSCLDSFRAIAPVEIEFESSMPPSDTAYLWKAWDTVWLPDSHCLLVASTPGLTLYDVDSPENPLLLVPSSGRILGDITVNPESLSIAFSVAEDPITYVVNTAGGVDRFQTTGEMVTEIAFSSDGRLLGVASSDIDDWGIPSYARIQLWELTTQRGLGYIVSHTGHIEEITFSPDNQHLLVGSYTSGYYSGYIDYWDITTSSRLWMYDGLLLPLQMVAHDTVFAIWGLSDYMNYSNYSGSAIEIWDAERHVPQLRIRVNSRDEFDAGQYVSAMAFSSNGAVLAANIEKGPITLWNTANGNKIAEIDVPLAHIRQIAFSPDGRFLAIHGQEEILIWDMREMKAYTTLR